MNIGKIPAKTARLDPAREALVDIPHQRRMTYGELDERVRRLANALTGELALQKGDRVAILSKNCVEYMEIYYACARCGMIAQPLNWRLGVEEMQRILQDGEPSMVVISGEYIELRDQLQGTGVSVTRVGDQIILNMPGNITFATDSSDLSPAFFDVLNSVGKVLNEFNQTVVEVAGHTDSTGSDAYNQGLSERRASSVATYLRGRGVMTDRLITVGMGESRPIADNGSVEGRQANRRVEITMVPVTAS